MLFMQLIFAITLFCIHYEINYINVQSQENFKLIKNSTKKSYLRLSTLFISCTQQVVETDLYFILLLARVCSFFSFLLLQLGYYTNTHTHTHITIQISFFHIDYIRRLLLNFLYIFFSNTFFRAQFFFFFFFSMTKLPCNTFSYIIYIFFA